MGARQSAEIDSWLRDGGLVVTASDRAARAVASAFHGARLAEGLTAWPAPNILDWKAFARREWERRTLDSRLLLNPLQEQSLWAAIAGAEGRLATLLEGPRHRLAAMAMEAHELLCAYAPRLLRTSARAAWQQDAAAFSNWLAVFDESCRAGNLLSASRLPLELILLLESDRTQRAPLLLAGFDRILPLQRAFFEAWGPWRQTALEQPAAQILFYQAADAQAELAACARWAGSRLADNSSAHLLVVTQDASRRRGEIERAFLRHSGSAASPLFEFSLGVPLSKIALPHSAQLLLRWLSGPLAEHELDWLLSAGTIANAQESTALEAHMRALRRHSQEQPQWTLADFIGLPQDSRLPPAWVERVREAQRLLAESAQRSSAAPARREGADPLAWAELVPRLLDAAGFAFAHPLSSPEFQALRRWNQTLETCGSLGFDGHRVPWQEFLSTLSRALDETLFAPESRGAPIQIAGPAESAGLAADAIWFLGADEDAWPAGGSTHPLLPLEVQRQASMPHATPQLDWELAEAVTARLLASAAEVHFSYARQKEGIEVRPSLLIAKVAGAAQPLPPELAAPGNPLPLTVIFNDASQVPSPPGKVSGGSAALTAQSQCPFKAFATARLAAEDWSPAEAGLTASRRGQLLHAVLHAVWSGPPDGIRSLKELQKLKDKEPFVAGHVKRAMRQEISAALRKRMPRRYLELEEQRLTRLVTEWLEYEAARMAFEVAETEVKRTVHIEGLTFDLRLDRIDRLNENSLLVIDYKSGDVSPKSWELPRPDDVQLPLYAGFALGGGEKLGGLVFAKVRPGKPAFAGLAGDARATLKADLSRSSSLVKNNSLAESLIDWRRYIEELARNFVAGRAEVDPREYPKTCERCGLQTLCRIQESQSLLEDEDEDENSEGESDE